MFLHPTNILFAFVLACAVATGQATNLPAIGPAKLFPGTVLVENGVAECVVVYPSALPDYTSVAERITDGLREKYGVEFTLVGDDVVCPEHLDHPIALYKRKNMILLGNVYNNRAIMPLYAGFWCGVDGAYPGGAGYVLRTISNPWGTGKNCVLIGASALAGIELAVPEFLKKLPEYKHGSAVLPRLLTVVAGGEMAPLVADIIARADGYEIKYPDNVYNEPVDAFSGPAFRYHWTGDRRWAEIARAILLHIDAHYDRGFYSTSHYRFERFFRAWDIIEESGVFSPEEIQRISKRMVETAFRAPGCQLRGVLRHGGDRHVTASWMSSFVAADYISRTFPDSPELLQTVAQWRQLADATFGYSVTGRDDEDRYSSQDVAEMFMRWALLSGQKKYFASGMAREAFVFFLNYFDPLGYSCGLANYGDAVPESVYTSDHGLRYQANLLGYVYGDRRFTWLVRNVPVCGRGKTYFGPNCFGFYSNECHFAAPSEWSVAAQPPSSLLGMTVLPVDHRRYDERLEKKQAMPDRDSAIDKVWFRSGWGRNDQYLMLQCLQTFRDANTIPRFVDRGKIWLFHNSNEEGAFYRNGLYVSDGVNQSATQNYYACCADNLARFDNLALSRTTISDVMGVDWTRTIIWLPQQWFLVLDHANVLKTNQMVLTCSWRLLHPGKWQNDRFLVATAGDAEFHLKSAAPISATTKQWDVLESSACPFFLRQVQSGECLPGTVFDFQNLLYVKDQNESFIYEPLRIDAFTVLVRDSANHAVLIGVGTGMTNALGITANPECVYVATPDRLYLSNAKTVMFGTNKVFAAETPATVALDFADGSVVSGADAAMLFAMSKTWELPGSDGRSYAFQMAPERIAEWLRLASASITVPTDYNVDHDTASVRRTAERYVFHDLAQNPNAACVLRKITGLSFTSPNVLGESALATDGTKEPNLRGILTWPQGGQPKFSLALGRTERLQEMILYFYGWPRAATGFLDPEQQSLIPVYLLGDNGAMGQKTNMYLAVQERFSISKISNKGKADALGCVMLSLGGQNAVALKMTLPFDVSGYANLKEVELFTADTVGAQIDSVAVNDLDGDGDPEILATYQDHRGRGILKVFASDARELWAKQADGAFTCVVADDVNGDGRLEVLTAAADYGVRLFAADGALILEKSMRGLNKASGGRQWPYGEVPTGIGLWEIEANLKRIVVGGYCHMSLFNPDDGNIVGDRHFSNSRYVWKILKQQPRLNGSERRAVVLLHYVNNSSPGDANIVQMQADDTLAVFNYAMLIPDGKYAAELTEGEAPHLAVIGARGFGLYKTDLTLTGVKHYELPVWSQLYTRPVSSGALLDLNDDGRKDFLVGGEDGFLSAFNHEDGRLLAKAAVGEPILDVFGFGSGADALLVVNTGSACLFYDRELRRQGGMEAEYVKAFKLREDGRNWTMAGFGRNGSLAIKRIAWRRRFRFF